jgi:phenylalanyl-tRNA synthetase beta chain
MIGCGFEEVMTNVLVSKRSIFSNMNLKGKAIEISNPISDSYTVLRNSIIPSLLEVESASREAVYPHRIFEIGEIVIPDAKSKVKSKTQIRLASLVAHPSSNFSELNSVLNNLAYYLGFSYRLQKTSHPSFIKGRVGDIVIGEKPVGIIGEVHPQVLENWKIKCPVTVFELSYFGTKDF